MTVTSPYDNPAADQRATARSPSPSSTSPTAASRRSLELGNGDRGLRRGEPAVEGLTVEYGGDLFGEFELPESEILGIIAAVIILILAFGSVLAMGLPIGTALFGLGIGSALVVAAQQRHLDARLHDVRWWR